MEFNPHENSNLRVSTSVPAVGTFAQPRDCHFHFEPGSLHARHTRNERSLNNFERYSTTHAKQISSQDRRVSSKKPAQTGFIGEKKKTGCQIFRETVPTSFDIKIRGAIKKLIRRDSACIVNLIFRVAHSSSFVRQTHVRFTSLRRKNVRCLSSDIERV